MRDKKKPRNKFRFLNKYISRYRYLCTSKWVRRYIPVPVPTDCTYGRYQYLPTVVLKCDLCTFTFICTTGTGNYRCRTVPMYYVGRDRTVRYLLGTGTYLRTRDHWKLEIAVCVPDLPPKYGTGGTVPSPTKQIDQAKVMLGEGFVDYW